MGEESWSYAQHTSGSQEQNRVLFERTGTVDKVERRVILDSLPAMHPYQFSKAAIPHLLSTPPVDVHAQEPLFADIGTLVRATTG